MASFTLTGGNDTGTLGGAGSDFVTVNNLTDLTTGDTVDAGGFIGEGAGNEDNLQIKSATGGTLDLSAANLPNVKGLERLFLDGAATATAFVFDINHTFMTDNYSTAYAQQGFVFNLSTATVGQKIVVSGSSVRAVIADFGSGDDTYTGGATSPDWVILTTGGNDAIDLDGGNDRFEIAAASVLTSSDTVNAGAGTDTIAFTSGASYAAADFANVSGFEQVSVTNFGANLSVVFGAGVFTGPVQTTIDGPGGYTRLLDFSAVPHSINVNSNIAGGATTVAGGTNNDTLRGGVGADSIKGGSGADSILPGAALDTISTGDGADTVFGTFAEISNNTITDFGVGDVIFFSDTTFNGIMPSTGTGTGMTANFIRLTPAGNALFLDANGDGSSDAEIYLTKSGYVVADFLVTAGKIEYVGIPTFAFSSGTDNLTGFTAGPDLITVPLATDLTAVDTMDATKGDTPANADTLKLLGGGTYTLYGGTLTGIQGIEAIFAADVSGGIVKVDAAFLDNNYDSNNQLVINATPTTVYNHRVELSGTPTGGRGFVVNLPGMTTATWETVVGSDGGDIVYINGKGNDQISLGAGADTVVSSDPLQLDAGDAIDGGTSGADTWLIQGTGGTYTTSSIGIADFEVVRFGTLSAATSLVLHDGFFSGTVLSVDTTAVGGPGLTVNASAVTGTRALDFTGIAAVGITASGAAGDDTVRGSGFIDLLNGGAGADKIYPGLGVDQITLGGGADTVYGSATELASDVIADFGTGDKIVVSSVTFGGIMASKGTGSGLTPGWIQLDTGGSKLYLDTDNNGSGETEINLTGGYAVADFSVSGGTIAFGAVPPLTFTAGAQTIFGTAGNDTFTASAGNLDAGDKVVGSGGVDVVSLTGTGTFALANLDGLSTISHLTSDNTPKTIELPTATNIKLVGGDNNETLSIGGGAHTVWGGNGQDTLQANAGTMTVISNGGLDNGTLLTTLTGSAGGTFYLEGDQVSANTSGALTVVANTSTRGTLVVQNGAGTLTAFLTIANSSGGGGSAADSLYGGTGSQHLDGGDNNDVLIGEAGPDILSGGNGNDILSGGSENDILVTGLGADTVFGGTGADIIVLDGPASSFDLIADFTPGQDRLSLMSFGFSDFTLFEAGTTATQFSNGWRYEYTSYPGTGFDVVTPNKLTAADFFFGQVQVGGLGFVGDNLSGNTSDDLLFGLGGNDTLNGGGGNDTLIGGGGQDQLLGGADNDLFFFGGTDSRALAAAHATIGDFATGDKIRLAPDAMGLGLTTGTSFSLNTVAGGFANDVVELMTLAGAAPASSAATVNVVIIQPSGGTLTGSTWVLLNDATATVQNSDMLIKIVGATPVVADFSVGTPV